YGDLRLQDGSPAIDFGDYAFLPSDFTDLDGDGDLGERLPLDLAGQQRIVRGQVDLGAYENQMGVANEPGGETPAAFALRGAYPNPFNPSTTLRFDLPTNAAVTAEVYDVLGRRVLRLGPQEIAAGAGRVLRLDGSGLPSGAYLYRVTARMGARTEAATGRFTLVR
ncbi:MAG TPA: T9SS type A sorting domain-containing protein, partial [Rubricoccaceae bacterium]|nr:T9SS type A sorting domain-containing protein [Rubricoccaceae bacterium]